jgi:WD40-like Beta Propeller Repeat
MVAPPTVPPLPPPPQTTGPGKPTSAPRLLAALAAMTTWIAGASIAGRILGFYPSIPARDVLGTGWIVALGCAWWAASRSRWRIPLAVIVAAAILPVVLVVSVPGIRRPTIYPVPGGGSYAATAAPLGQYDVYLIRNGDGSDPIQLTHTPWSENWSTLSPDGAHVVYTSAGSAGVTSSLHVMTIDKAAGVTSDRIIVTGVDPWIASWSSDGDTIYFSKTTSSGSSIYASDLSGHFTRVIDDGWGPSPSPDGTKIAFSRAGAIWVAGTDGSDARAIAAVGPADGAPLWSPDGTLIAFDGLNDVYVVNPDGSGLRDLTSNTRGGVDYPAVWTPDDHLIFASNRSNTGGRFAYSMNADGSNVRLAWIL